MARFGTIRARHQSVVGVFNSQSLTPNADSVPADIYSTISRYYVLVAACVLARKLDWLRNASLAAALIFPAVAAIHGIILAILHTDNYPSMSLVLHSFRTD